MSKPVTAYDPASWLNCIWDALQEHRFKNIPEGIPENDAQWDEITTAMAWVQDSLGVDDAELDQESTTPED